MYKYAQVVIEFATVTSIDKFFTYKISEQLIGQVACGCRVSVPFGRGKGEKIGYVTQLMEEVADCPYPIKEIVGLVDPKPILSAQQLRIATFLVEYYGATYAASIDAVLPPGITSKAMAYTPPSVVCVALAVQPEVAREYICANQHKKSFAMQQQILTYLLSHGKVPLSVLTKEQGMRASTVTTLLSKGYLKKEIEVQSVVPSSVCQEAFRALNEEQQVAYEVLSGVLKRKAYETVLLKGVTGSGKTEVFLHTIREVLAQGGSAIVLVPEIALTKQTLDRFVERFGNRVALTHSRMTPKERQNIYFRAQLGEISIVIGPRSAVFLPLPNVKLIVVDEEHEATYKSEVTPKYHAIEVAKMRMKENNGLVLLASATPSVETYYQYQVGEIGGVELSKRVGGATLPQVELVDMRAELQRGNTQVISAQLYEEMKLTLESNNQVMLLLNRRGHSTFVNCRNCGYVVKCQHCDVSMTYHLYNKSLECHYCGSRMQVPTTCPSCQSPYIRFFGNGTEKVEEYLLNHFEAYGVGRMDFDTTGGKEGHSKILSAFKERRINVLIGTQMIAKGHDFPNVTLVGVVAADMSLYMQDFRSAERTYQLLTQALGRAGRGDKSGKVIIQTYNPEHVVLQKVKYHQQDAFYKEELASRQLLGYPPYSHIFSLLFSGRNEREVIKVAHHLTSYYQYYNKKGQFRLIGPVVATIGKVADEYRWKLIIVAEDREKLMLYGKYCLNKFVTKEVVENVKIYWDIDPMGMI